MLLYYITIICEVAILPFWYRIQLTVTMRGGRSLETSCASVRNKAGTEERNIVVPTAVDFEF